MKTAPTRTKPICAIGFAKQIIPKLSKTQRTNLLKNISQTSKTNRAIENAINNLLDSKVSPQGLERTWFNQLPHDVAKEIMVAWLRQNGLQFDRRMIEKLGNSRQNLFARQSCQDRQKSRTESRSENIWHSLAMSASQTSADICII